MTETAGQSDTHREALALANAGRNIEALAALREHLLEAPEDGEALNDAGAILYALGRHAEATRHILAALEHLQDARPQALLNLLEVYLAAERPDEALGILEQIAGSDGAGDLAARTADAFCRRGDLAGAIEALLLAGRQADSDRLRRLRERRPKIALFRRPGSGPAEGDTADYLRARYRLRLVTDDDPGRHLAWCDVAWFDGLGPAVLAACRRPRCCRTVLRLGPGDVRGDAPRAVRWRRIDVLALLGGPEVRDQLRRAAPSLDDTTRLVDLPVGIDTGRIELRRRATGKRLACPNAFGPGSLPHLVLQCFAALHRADGEYRLHLGGICHDEALHAYLEWMTARLGLTDSVHLDGWQDDPAAWLADKHYLVSATVTATDPAPILAATASGIRPVIHACPGAGDFFPPWATFHDPAEFCRRVLDTGHPPETCREFVERSFPPRVHRQAVAAILRDIEADPLPAWFTDDTTIRDEALAAQEAET